MLFNKYLQCSSGKHPLLQDVIRKLKLDWKHATNRSWKSQSPLWRQIFQNALVHVEAFGSSSVPKSRPYKQILPLPCLQCVSHMFLRHFVVLPLVRIRYQEVPQVGQVSRNIFLLCDLADDSCGTVDVTLLAQFQIETVGRIVFENRVNAEDDKVPERDARCGFDCIHGSYGCADGDERNSRQWLRAAQTHRHTLRFPTSTGLWIIS